MVGNVGPRLRQMERQFARYFVVAADDEDRFAFRQQFLPGGFDGGRQRFPSMHVRDHGVPF